VTQADLPQGTVTFVFTDIEGSTRLLTKIGADYSNLLSKHHALLRRHIEMNHGAEVKTEGDAFFVVFGSPAQALTFAVNAQRELRTTDWGPGIQVLVRMGIHTGEGVLSEGDYVGLDVHRAARISSAGHGGQVLLSNSAVALLDRTALAGVRLRDLGEHRLKDLPEPVHLFDLVIDGVPSDFPPIRSIGKGSLPEELTSFVGREREVAKVSALLGGARLVTLTGPGGTGKTRLSIEVARNVQETFTDGAWFVPLEEITDPDLVPPAIARVMGVKEDPLRPQIETLTEALAQRRALIVLDNFEQVVGAARHINRLLRDAPSPRVLCSSREALRIAGEQESPVPPLDDEPAVRLFVQRALQVRPDFAPSKDDLATVAEICAAVDRLPLAIELAAARVRLFPLGTLLSRLTDRLETLSSSRRDLSERQRTLRGAIEWSYELLDETERKCFARLAVFAGGADLAAIEAIVDPSGEVIGDVIDVLASLVDKSLVVAAEGSGEPRYRMLDTIRAFAAERLAGDADADTHALRDRHMAHFLAVAEESDTELGTGDPVSKFAIVDAELDNIRAAIEWSLASGEVASGMRIGGAMWRFWQQHGHLVEARVLLDRLLEAPQPDDAFARGRAFTGYGGVVYWQGEYEQARQSYEKAIECYRTAGNARYEALGLFDLGFTLTIVRNLEGSAQALDESQRIFARLGDERGILTVGEGKAALALVAGDAQQAREIAESLVAGYQRLHMDFRAADTLGLLVAVNLELGDKAAAYQRWHQSTSMWSKSRDVSSRVFIYEFGARVAAANGHAREAAVLLGALQAIRDRGEPFLTPGVIMDLADPEPGVRAELTQEEYAEAFAEGRGWPPSEAFDRAANLEIGPQ